MKHILRHGMEVLYCDRSGEPLCEVTVLSDQRWSFGATATGRSGCGRVLTPDSMPHSVTGHLSGSGSLACIAEWANGAWTAYLVPIKRLRARELGQLVRISFPKRKTGPSARPAENADCNASDSESTVNHQVDIPAAVEEPAWGRADWIFDHELGIHIPSCSHPKGNWHCGNGPLTGAAIESGDCGEHDFVQAGN